MESASCARSYGNRAVCDLLRGTSSGGGQKGAVLLNQVGGSPVSGVPVAADGPIRRPPTAPAALPSVSPAARLASEAHKAYAEALAIRRELAQANPGDYQPYVAMTPRIPGVPESDEHHYSKARQPYDEALPIYEQFAAKNPARYRKDVQRLRGLMAQLLNR